MKENKIELYQKRTYTNEEGVYLTNKICVIL